MEQATVAASAASSPLKVEQLNHGTGRKRNIFSELLALLKSLVERCMHCACGCCPLGGATGKLGRPGWTVYEEELLEEEKVAVRNLYDAMETGTDIRLTAERLKALCILAYSDSSELQQTAALYFAELSESSTESVTDAVMEPLLVLLQSRDLVTQRDASLALSNFALLGPERNKAVIMDCGALATLIKLLRSADVEVQCNACGCLTTLSALEENVNQILSSQCLPVLIPLTLSADYRIRRNATGALLNLSHSESSRRELIQQGAIPSLVSRLASHDVDVQYYSAAALSNLAVSEKARAMMVAVGYCDVIRSLLALLGSPYEKVQYQACLALRNLASDPDTQLLIVRQKALPVLQNALHKPNIDVVAAAAACLKNLSIHKTNESAIVKEGLVDELCTLLRDSTNPEAQAYCAGILRNLAAGEYFKEEASNCVVVLTEVLLYEDTTQAVLQEVVSALSLLAESDPIRHQLTRLHDGQVFLRLAEIAANSSSAAESTDDIAYNAAAVISHMVLSRIAFELVTKARRPLLAYLKSFIQSEDDVQIHMALWTILHLLDDEQFVEMYTHSQLPDEINTLTRRERPPMSADVSELVDSIAWKLTPDSRDSTPESSVEGTDVPT